MKNTFDKCVCIAFFIFLLIVVIVGVIYYFPVDQWPDSGLATLIDEPESAMRIEIVENTADRFQARVKGIGLSYKKYVEMCSSAFGCALDITKYHGYAPELRPFCTMADMFEYTTDYRNMTVLSTYDHFTDEIDGGGYYRAYDAHGNRLTIHRGDYLLITVQSAEAVAESLAEHAPEIPYTAPQDEGDLEAHYKEQMEATWDMFSAVEEELEALQEIYFK